MKFSRYNAVITSFSSHRLLTVLSVIRNLNLLKSLITGKTSYLNSTSLLMYVSSFDPVLFWKHICYAVLYKSGSHLPSHTVTSIVLSAASVLTIVFGMWTGVSQKRIATGKIELDNSTVKNSLLDFLRKEVIQPHLPIRLPCYDFTPVIRPAFDGSFLTVRSPASGISDSHGVTGGVYKTRERIHRSILICDY